GGLAGRLPGRGARRGPGGRPQPRGRAADLLRAARLTWDGTTGCGLGWHDPRGRCCLEWNPSPTRRFVMSQITETVDVDVPISVAYDQWTQFETFPQFMEGVESVTQVDDTRNRWKVEVAGATREFDTEISEQHPEERIAWTTVGGDLQQAGVVTFHKLDEDSTRVTIQMDWDPQGAMETAGAALGVDDRRVKGDAMRFKEFIESRGTQTGSW